jgi:hypothetical protein
MSSRRLALALSAVLLAGLASTIATAAPPRPGTEGNNLTENESATLWSRDDDSRYISNAAYREAYGEHRTLIQQVANRTDLTFTQPPETADVWTRNDHADYQSGDRTTSIYPENATLSDSRFIKDAHASVFAVTPSTKTHRVPAETTLYVAPEGRLLGTVDYRVRTPSGIDSADRTVSWTVDSHEITEVKLLSDREVLARADGQHRPDLAYELRGHETALTLEADIEVTLEKTVEEAYYVNVTGPNGTNRTEKRWQSSTTTVEDSVTVSDGLGVEVYDLSVILYRTTYPDGSSGVAVFQNRPWQGYTLDADGPASVRGVWRFYTARDTDWETLTRATAEGRSSIESDALPVYVHAYPSELGPRTEPVRGGPEITHVWGTTREAPRRSIGENVHVEVVENSYETSYGVAVRSPEFSRDEFTVRGIVRGVTATVDTAAGERAREIRESSLSAEVLSRNETGATVRLELVDAETGEPIRLDRTTDSRYAPLFEESRSGYVTIADRRVETNASGMATVHLDEPGLYTARYHPGSWLSHDPAYASDTASVRWHPLTTVTGWVSLITRIILWFLPFGIAWYAGSRLGRIFNWEVR